MGRLRHLKRLSKRAKTIVVGATVAVAILASAMAVLASGSSSSGCTSAQAEYQNGFRTRPNASGNQAGVVPGEPACPVCTEKQASESGAPSPCVLSEAEKTTFAEKEQQHENEQYPEKVKGSKFWQEEEALEKERVEAGKLANAETAEKEQKAAEEVETKREGKEPAHSTKWYRQQAINIHAESAKLLLSAQCREQHGPEAVITAILEYGRYNSVGGEIEEGTAQLRALDAVEGLENQVPFTGTCAGPSGEQWRVQLPKWSGHP